MGANASHEPLGPDATRGNTKPHNPGNLFSPYGRASLRKSLRRRKSKRKQKENQKEDTPGSQVEGPSEAQLRKMDKLRKSLRDSFRKKKEVPESSKPHLWQSDEAGVKAGTCSFLVKYMGCVEVYESRGMQVCEEALKVLRNSRRRPIRGILYVSGDGLRVVDDETKGLLVDQTIEKVSFCAPDRNHERGFSYICRDGTTRRWMCHGFIAVKESGERLSHAVGCAFAACLERKQKRDKECGVTMTFDQNTSTFTRMGSFRQMSVTERLSDPQECKPIVDPVPVKKVENPHAIARPHATPQLLQRQGSFRVFNHLNQSSPFKRQLSLRLTDLPSNIERTRSLSFDTASFPDDENDNININNILNNNNNNTPPAEPLSPTEGVPVAPQGPPRTQRSRLHSLPIAVNMAPIPETSPLTEPSSVAPKTDAVSAMCQQVSAGLSLLSNFPDDIISPPAEKAPEVEALPATLPRVTSPLVAAVSSSTSTPSTFMPTATSPSIGGLASPPSPPAQSQYPQSVVAGNQDHLFKSPLTSPPHTGAGTGMSKGEEWLAQINSQASQQEISSGVVQPPRRHPPLSQLRSSSLGSSPQSDSSPSHTQQSTIAPTSNFSTSFSPSLTNGSSPPLPMTTRISPFPPAKPPGGADPFDAEWVALSTRGHNPNNPFLPNAVTKAFQVQM